MAQPGPSDSTVAEDMARSLDGLIKIRRNVLSTGRQIEWVHNKVMEVLTGGHTCLSTEPHPFNIKNHVFHYFGCLKFAERHKYFENVQSPDWQITIRPAMWHSSEEAKVAPDEHRKSWEASCHYELQLVAFLREKLSKDQEDSHLVECLNESRAKCLPHLSEHARARGFNLATSITEQISEIPSPPICVLEQSKTIVEASLMCFRGADRGFKGIDLQADGIIRGVFPNQTTALNSLLFKDFDSGSNHQEERMEYFHLPYNDMNVRFLRPWVEVTIANHFNGDDLFSEKEDKRLRMADHARQRAKNITRNLYGQNQIREFEHTKPYSRRLRPLSTIITSGIGDNPDHDLVVFVGFVSVTRSQMMPADKIPRCPTYIGKPIRKGKVDTNGRVSAPNPLGQYLLDAARLFQGMAEYRDKQVIQKNIMSNTPLYLRRTLEQGYHWTLEGDEDHSKDQILYRATKARAFHLHNAATRSLPYQELALTGDCQKCREDSRKVASIVMVDQLWMWILDSRTIITCFPDQYGSQRLEASGVHKGIRTRIQIHETTSQLGSVFDLGLIIIDECSDAIFDRGKTTNAQPELVDVFSAKIGRIRNRQQSLFKKFWKWATEIEKKIQVDRNSADVEVPLDLFTEGMLIRELKDMIEELDIMIYTMRTQKEILRSYIANAERLLDPFNEFRSNNQRIYLSRQRKRSGLSRGKELSESEEDQRQAAQEDKFYTFRVHADECSAKLLARMETLEGLREAANAGVDSVKDLLELKGQQASLIQAWRSSVQSEETVNQGRVILVFTLVTIVFLISTSKLPLSFMSSIFGMNNVEFDSGSWPIRDEIVYTVAVSVSVIAVSLGLAFNAWLRSGIWYVYKVVTTQLLVSTGLYGLWCRFGIPAETLDTRGRRTARDLFRDAAAAVKEKPPPDPNATPPAKDTATLTGRVAGRWRRMHSRNPDPEDGGTART
ncbi:hypothetical protein PG985_011767 [Apiospora marii]|uniref:uncharacterized protein n=1 Tax=Apiospora marii TaxID=335849 RepID=UPI00312E1BC6